MNQTTRLLAAVALAPAAAVILASCGSTGSQSASPAESSSTSTASSTTSATSSTSARSSTSATSSTEAPAGKLDTLQLTMRSDEEKSPGVLQYGGFGVDVDIEWMGLEAGNAYNGQKCAAVLTLTDPAGAVVETHRASTCTGTFGFTRLVPSKNPTGEYTVKGSLAPWEDPDTPVTAEQKFTVIAEGA